MRPQLNRSLKLCSTDASFRHVNSAISSTRSNFGGFILWTSSASYFTSWPPSHSCETKTSIREQSQIKAPALTLSTSPPELLENIHKKASQIPSNSVCNSVCMSESQQQNCRMHECTPHNLQYSRDGALEKVFVLEDTLKTKYGSLGLGLELVWSWCSLDAYLLRLSVLALVAGISACHPVHC